MASTPTATRPELSRDLGVSHASAVVVGTIIGSGIFLVPAEMMQAVGSAKLVYLAWIVGGLLSFFGALTYAELGAMKPQAGGEYVYVRDGYGPLGGFLYAWTWFVIAKPASIATVVTGLVRILGTFSVFSFFSANVISTPFSVTWGQLVAIAAAILISFLNYLGVKKAGEFQLGVHAAESRHHSRDCLRLLQRNRRRARPRLEQLCRHIHRGKRRHCWIHGGFGRGALGL